MSCHDTRIERRHGTGHVGVALRTEAAILAHARHPGVADLIAIETDGGGDETWIDVAAPARAHPRDRPAPARATGRSGRDGRLRPSLTSTRSAWRTATSRSMRSASGPTDEPCSPASTTPAGSTGHRRGGAVIRSPRPTTVRSVACWARRFGSWADPSRRWHHAPASGDDVAAPACIRRPALSTPSAGSRVPWPAGSCRAELSRRRSRPTSKGRACPSSSRPTHSTCRTATTPTRVRGARRRGRDVPRHTGRPSRRTASTGRDGSLHARATGRGTGRRRRARTCGHPHSWWPCTPTTQARRAVASAASCSGTATACPPYADGILAFGSARAPRWAPQATPSPSVDGDARHPTGTAGADIRDAVVVRLLADGRHGCHAAPGPRTRVGVPPCRPFDPAVRSPPGDDRQREAPRRDHRVGAVTRRWALLPAWLIALLVIGARCSLPGTEDSARPRCTAAAPH